MKFKVPYAGIIFVALLFLLGMSLLKATDPSQMTLLFFSILCVGISLPLLLKHNQRSQLNQFFIKKIEILESCFDKESMYAIADQNYRIIDTNTNFRGNDFQEFLEEKISEFKNYKGWLECQENIENYGETATILSNRSTSAKFIFFQYRKSNIQNSGEVIHFVSFRDLTPFFASLEKVRIEHEKLKKFIDTAPIGLFFKNNKGKILEVNQTLALWLCQDKHALKDINEGEILDVDPLKNSNSSQITELKPLKKPTLPVVYFPPQGTECAGIICKLDDMLNLAHNERYETTFLKSQIPGLIIDKNAEIIQYNNSFEKLCEDNGVRYRLGQKNPFYDVLSANSAHILRKIMGSKDIKPLELALSGDKTHCIAYISRLHNTHENYLVQMLDISHQKDLEKQFIQSQKMQAVGQLAGGIAHDFNNLLTAMIGFCDLLLQRFMPNDPSYADITQIKQNANRAANLVRQLLAFSRQQTLKPEEVYVSDALAELMALLRRLIGVKIELEVLHSRDLWPIKVDLGQFEQIIVNLVVNARDAINSNGKITIQTQNVELNEPKNIVHDIIAKGDYVTISIIDTGAGIKKEDLAHIFEPFFTTKGVGEGTGLGLATVYGILQQTGGSIDVESALKKGTTFTIYLPRLIPRDEKKIATTTIDVPRNLNGTEKILLVEDEDGVRSFSARALRDKGYQVVEARNGLEAIEMLNQEKPFDLIITDVVMPLMDGPEFYKEAMKIQPNVPTIFMSGYAEDAFRQSLDSDQHMHFISKPFTLKELAANVKKVLHT